MKRLTTEQFIKRAKLVHGNKYDYSLVEYKNTATKVKIICPVHGIFEQRPNDHLNGKGCSKCSKKTSAKKRQKTTEQFIKEAKKIHCDKYDYSLVNYQGNKIKVKIICPVHGIFEQRPNDHLNGKGCKFCAGNTIKTAKQFIEEAKKIHGNKYNYNVTKYVNNKIKVKIICPIHGIFEQSPNDHLGGKGCKFCAGNTIKTTEQFIKEAKKIHGDNYNYSLVEYVNAKTKIKIICNSCKKIFEQTPDKHYKQCCPYCSSSKGEKQIRNYLKEKKIIFEEQKKFNDLRDKSLLSYDFYIPLKNLLIEYNGIQHYKSNDYFGGYGKFLIQKHHDWLKRKYAIKNNINLLIIPYWEYNNINKILLAADCSDNLKEKRW